MIEKENTSFCIQFKLYELYNEIGNIIESKKLINNLFQSNPEDPEIAYNFAKTFFDDDLENYKKLYQSLLNNASNQNKLKIHSFFLENLEWMERRKKGKREYYAEDYSDLGFKYSSHFFENLKNISKIESHNLLSNPNLINSETVPALLLHFNMLCHERNYSEANKVLILINNLFKSIFNCLDFNFLANTSYSEEQIIGDFPNVDSLKEIDGNSHSNIIFISSDYNYFELYGSYLLKSILNFGDTCRIHLHIFDANEEQRKVMRTLVNENSKFQISCNTESTAFYNTNFAPIYYHTVRFIRLYQFAKLNPNANIWLTDVDGLFNQSPLNLFNTFKGEFDIAVRMRPARIDIWNQINACLMCFHINQKTLIYLKNISYYLAHIIKSNKAAWMLDQIALYMALIPTNFIRELKIKYLQSDAIDYEYIESGIVWYCSGVQKHSIYAGKNINKKFHTYMQLLEKYKN
jgi:hypothetical protein